MAFAQWLWRWAKICFVAIFAGVVGRALCGESCGLTATAVIITLGLIGGGGGGKAKKKTQAKDESSSETAVAKEGLLAEGVDVNKRDEHGNTPLHDAAMLRSKKLDKIKALLELGADVNARNEGGATPLHFVNREMPDSGMLRDDYWHEHKKFLNDGEKPSAFMKARWADYLRENEETIRALVKAGGGCKCAK